MPNYTPNLNLVKPIVTEQYDIDKVTNENADKIDLLLAPKANPTFTGLTELPLTTTLGGQDIRTLLMPKNWIINGMFDVWQRSTSQTTSGYGSDDRFSNEHIGSTKTVSRQAFTVGQTDVPNNPTYFSRTVVSSVTGVGNVVTKSQRIEDVTKLAGKTVSVSFWAKADANKNISIELTQNFGTGEQVSTIGVQKFALTTSWQRFTKVITLPSVLGKTIATGNFIRLMFWFDAGANFDARTNSLGHQSGTFDIANISLVEGSVAIECKNQPYADVLRECMRYYQRFGVNSGNATSAYSIYGYGFTTSTTIANVSVQLKSRMRTTPSTIDFAELALNDQNNVIYAVSSITIDTGTSNDDICTLRCVSTGLTTARVCRLLNNNITNGYIGFSSEI